MKKNLFSLYIILAVVGLTIIFLFPADGKTQSRLDLSGHGTANSNFIMQPEEIIQPGETAVDIVVVGKPTLISPSGHTFGTKPAYTWYAVANATWYHIWVNTSTGTLGEKWYTAAEVGCPAGTGNCSLTAPNPLAPGTYTWWIQAWYNVYGPWSDGKLFLVDPNGEYCQNISSVGFTPVNSSVTYTPWMAGERYRTGGTATSFEAPVHLPAGAQITSIFLDYWDEYASGDVSVALSISGTGGVASYPVTSSGVVFAYRRLERDLTPLNLIVDNVGHSYFIRVDLPAIDFTTSFVRAIVCHKPIP